MCSRPQEKDGKTFACRSCDECIATRRHQWVARAMMEKAMWPHAIALTLTYDDSTPENRDAARMFQYRDVRLFLARLREQLRAEGKPSRVRFICAGEQGDRNGRCHWHIVIFSEVDLTTVGEFTALVGSRRKVLKYRSHIVSEGNRKRRLHWNIWGHGFVVVQEPDEGGMHYVLSYCLKDQFTEERSRETGRYAKSENFATGLFRMSKRPAIGDTWLWSKFEKLAEAGAVLPNLALTIPGFRGQFVPHGETRQKILWAMNALNKRVLWTTGRNAPQWSSLLSSLQDYPPDMEILNGPSSEQLENVETFESELAKRQREHAGYTARREFAKTCGNALPCEACLAALSDDLLTALGVERYVDGGAYFFRAAQGFAAVETRQREFTGHSNPYCQRRGSKISRHTFPDTDRTTLTHKGSGHL